MKALAPITWIRRSFDAVTIPLLVAMSCSPAFAQTTTGGTGLTSTISSEATSRLPSTGSSGSTNVDNLITFMTWAFFLCCVYFAGWGLVDGMNGRGWGKVGGTMVAAIGAIVIFGVVSSATK
jgi:hypothetical protein